MGSRNSRESSKETEKTSGGSPNPKILSNDPHLSSSPITSHKQSSKPSFPTYSLLGERDEGIGTSCDPSRVCSRVPSSTAFTVVSHNVLRETNDLPSPSPSQDKITEEITECSKSPNATTSASSEFYSLLYSALDKVCASAQAKEESSGGKTNLSSFETVQDEGLPPESSKLRPATIDTQLVREKAVVDHTDDALFLAAQKRESMPLFDKGNMLSYATAPESLQPKDDSVPTSLKPMPDVVYHEVMPSAPKQNKETLSSIEQAIPSFTLATESLPHSMRVYDYNIKRQSVYETIRIPLLTFDEYEQQRRQLIKFLLQKLKQEYIDELWTILTQPPYDYSEKTARKFAEDLLDPDSNFSCNPDGDSELDGKLDDYRQRWLQTEDEQLLMLRFPLREVSRAQNCRLSLHEDDESRKQQNREFVTMYGGNPGVHSKRIETRDELFQYISSFLSTGCSSTCLATIVFNGHGSKNGLRVHSGAYIPLNDIINDVVSLMNTIRGSTGNTGMPRAVDIVFPQCFGHLHEYTEDPSKLINVISLVSDQHPRSYQNIKSSGQSTHFELESYAERRTRLKQKARVSNSSEPEYTTTSLQGVFGITQKVWSICRLRVSKVNLFACVLRTASLIDVLDRNFFFGLFVLFFFYFLFFLFNDTWSQ